VALVVEKFGGTSVSDSARIRAVADHVVWRRDHGDDLVLVDSAMGSETDQLLRFAGEHTANDAPGMEGAVRSGERAADEISAAL